MLVVVKVVKVAMMVLVVLVLLVLMLMLVVLVVLMVLAAELLTAGHSDNERRPLPGVAIKIAAPNPGIESGQEY
jgi:hypothetical protein